MYGVILFFILLVIIVIVLLSIGIVLKIKEGANDDDVHIGNHIL